MLVLRGCKLAKNINNSILALPMRRMALGNHHNYYLFSSIRPVTFLSVPSYHTLVHRVRFHCSINSPEKTSLYMIKTACDSLMVIDPLLLDELCKAFGNTYILAERQQS